MTRRITTGRRGFTLVEAIVASVIVAVLLVAALNGVARGRAARGRIADRARGQQLALDMMAEILQQPYQDPGSLPVFGLEAGESATSRAAWNDVDDYNGWTESPPQTKTGTVIPDFTGWSRNVLVEWIDPTSLTATNTANTGIKRITVTVSRGAIPMASVAAYRSLGWVDTVPKPTDATGNHAPTAAATGSPLSGAAPLAVSFSGAGSADADGDTITYAWNFGDGATAAGSVAAHTYAAAGTYTATLTVYDGRGGVGVSSLAVSVTP